MKRICFGLLVSLAAAPPAAAQQPLAVVAHRGLAEGIPENTLAALRHSVARGVKVIEFDLRVSKDGHIVVIHDETLDRTTDCSGRVAEMTLAAFRNCDAGWPSHPGERVPTLAAALDFIDTTSARLLLDVKAAPLDDVLHVIRAHRAGSKIILGLRRTSDIARARAELPSVTILAFMPEAADAAVFVGAGAHIIRIWSDWVEADPGLVSRTRAIGPQVWVMVGRRLPSKAAKWRDLHDRMIATGAHGLITDRPDLIPGP